MGSVCAAGGESDAKIQAAREQFFEQNVRPLLAENCYSCHGDKKQKGGLRLDSLAAILKGGESGPAVVPGKPEESLLVDAINYAGPEMPPTGKLGAEKVAVLSRWVSLVRPLAPNRSGGACFDRLDHCVAIEAHRGGSHALVAPIRLSTRSAAAYRAANDLMDWLVPQCDRSVHP